MSQETENQCHSDNTKNHNPSDIISGFNLSFDQGIAEHIGIEAAIVYNHIIYWLKINASKPDSEMVEGKYWMHETQQQMKEFFRCLSDDQISRALKKLVDFGLIIKKTLSRNKFDRTCWYTVTNQELLKKSFRNTRNRGMHTPEIAESEPPEIAECIYTTKEQQKSVVVVGGTPPPLVVENVHNSICKEDVYAMSLRTKKNWNAEEIEKAWIIYFRCKYPITDPFAYIEGIINKNRMLKDHKKEKEKCTQKSQTNKQELPLKTLSTTLKDNSLEKDLSDAPLAQFSLKNHFKKKSQVSSQNQETS